MPTLEEIGQKVRGKLDRLSGARDDTVVLSREVIRTCANTIRAAHRGEIAAAHAQLRGAAEALGQMKERLADIPEVYYAGYVHDCQKEFAEAAVFLSVIQDEPLPDPDELGIEYAAFLVGMAEAVGEIRRHTLDVMRQGDLEKAEALLATMDEIYYALVTFDYPDAVTKGLRRFTDTVRGIIEKTRGELTTALRQEDLRAAIRDALSVYRSAGDES